jgi:hypothetical protein
MQNTLVDGHATCTVSKRCRQKDLFHLSPVADWLPAIDVIATEMNMIKVLFTSWVPFQRTASKSSAALLMVAEVEARPPSPEALYPTVEYCPLYPFSSSNCGSKSRGHIFKSLGDSIPDVHDLNGWPPRSWTNKKLPQSVAIPSTWQFGKGILVLELMLIVLLERRNPQEFFCHCNISLYIHPTLEHAAVKFEFPTILAIAVVLALEGDRCGLPLHPSYPSLDLLLFYIWHQWTNYRITFLQTRVEMGYDVMFCRIWVYVAN